MPIDPIKITTHTTDGVNRLLSQFNDKTLMKGLAESLVQGAQDVEDALYDTLTLRWINSAYGEQLDGIGEIVGKDRGGRTDSAYRIALLGKIAQNVSQSTEADLTAVYNLLTYGTKCFVQEHFPAEVAIFQSAPPIIGLQLLDDNDMELAGVGSWTAVNSATLTKESGSPYEGLQSLRVQWNGVNNPAARQYKLTPGDWYLINGRVRMEDASGPVPVVKCGAVTLYSGFPFAGWYEFDIIFNATSNTIDFGSDATLAKWVEYDDLTIYELNYADQQEIFDVCELVIGAGVRLVGIGWYEDDEMFSFFEDPTGLGFGDLLDPTVGGKFASLTIVP